MQEGSTPSTRLHPNVSLKNTGVPVSDVARKVVNERTFVLTSMRLLGLHPRVRKSVRQHTLSRKHALAPFRLEPTNRSH